MVRSLGGIVFAAARVLGPVIIDALSFRPDTRPSLLHAAHAAALDARRFFLLVRWLWLSAAVVVDWAQIDAGMATLKKRRIVYCASIG